MASNGGEFALNRVEFAFKSRGNGVEIVHLETILRPRHQAVTRDNVGGRTDRSPAAHRSFDGTMAVGEHDIACHILCQRLPSHLDPKAALQWG
jgi:hypothetical protein